LGLPQNTRKDYRDQADQGDPPLGRALLRGCLLKANVSLASPLSIGVPGEAHDG
jgi:hypothetical protein